MRSAPARKPRTPAGLFPQLLLDTHDELIVDLFAGGGGASLGIEMATGRQVDVAVNHDRAAVALHEANHPQTQHLTCDVFEVDPRKVTAGRPVGLLWASPDCTFHSKARGGKPFRDAARKRRALAWVVIRWAAQVRPRVIMLENVEEFAQWGPLVGLPGAQRPCPRRRGRTFRRWRRLLEQLGYQVEQRELRACDYGAPTIRKRLFVIARCDGAPIVWPTPTHGPGRRRPYRTAAECIDWSIPMLSIFATREEARAWGKAHGQATPVRPLAEATLRRIARGVKRFVLDAAKPFIVSLAHGESRGRREYPMGDPLGTQHAGGNKFAVVAPIIAGVGGRAGQSPERSGDLPLGTVTAKGDAAVVAPLLAHLTHHGEERAHATDAPAPTVTGAQRGELGLVAPYLAPHYGERAGQQPRVRSAEEPLPTIVPTENGGSLVGAFLARHWGGMVGKELTEPFPTVLTKGAQDQLAAVHLSHQYTSNTNGGEGDPARPVKTVTTGGHHALVASFLASYYGTDQQHQHPDEPLATIPTRDRFGLVTVTIEGVLYAIVDIAMRMLQPRELYRAQGFPDSYRIAVQIVDPKTKRLRWLTKTEQVRMVGNSVSPPQAAAIVAANCPWLVARDEVRLAGVRSA